MAKVSHQSNFTVVSGPSHIGFKIPLYFEVLTDSFMACWLFMPPHPRHTKASPFHVKETVLKFTDSFNAVQYNKPQPKYAKDWILKFNLKTKTKLSTWLNKLNTTYLLLCQINLSNLSWDHVPKLDFIVIMFVLWCRFWNLYKRINHHDQI